MKNLLITFFKVSGLTMITGLFSFLMLILLFHEVLHSVAFLIFAVIFLGGFTQILSFFILFLPVYSLNKHRFEQENIQKLFEMFLPIVLIPITLICLVFLLVNPRDFFDEGSIIAMITGYVITFFSFYQFIKFIKTDQ